MAWFYGTYACGHEGRVQIYGPTKDRQWKADREFSKLCPECWEKKLAEDRERQNAEAAAKAAEMGLPELTGTPKQVAWANTIRQKMIEKFHEITEDEVSRWARLKRLQGITMNEVNKILEYILKNKTKASFYIDNRGETVMTLVSALRDEVAQVDEKELEIIAELKTESTVYPENAITKAVAEISIKPDKVLVSFEKNEDFRKIVKSLGYSWNGSEWEKKISEKTGSAEERAAELGNKLLNAGFPVCILDEEIRKNAIDGKYEPECTRWIQRWRGTDNLGITWKERDESLYRRARSLPGSRWDRPAVVVNVAHYEEIEEFAELYGFKFTKKARALIEEFKLSLTKVSVVNPAKVKEAEQKDGLKEILNRGDDIIDDLRD